MRGGLVVLLCVLWMAGCGDDGVSRAGGASTPPSDGDEDRRFHGEPVPLPPASEAVVSDAVTTEVLRLAPEREQKKSWIAFFATDASGGPILVHGRPDRLQVWGDAAAVAPVARLPEKTARVHEIRTAAGKSYVALIDEGRNGFLRLRRAVCVDAEGRTQWEYALPGDDDLERAAVLHGVEGPFGVAFGPGGDAGVVALTGDGGALWDRPRQYVIYGIRTRARLPNLLLLAGGGFQVVHHSGRGIRQGCLFNEENAWRGHKQGALFSKTCELYVRASGKPAVAVGGHRFDGDAPAVAFFDLGHAWRATFGLPARPEAIVAVDPPGRQPLFFVALRDGRLLLLTEEGAIRWWGATPKLPGSARGNFIEAGRTAGNAWAVLRRHRGFLFLHTLDIGALAGK